MDDKKFNLLEEPWVCVMQENGEVKELSLIDALIHAHQYRGLSGELPTQDVAVLRLLLAVLQTVVYRYPYWINAITSPTCMLPLSTA